MAQIAIVCNSDALDLLASRIRGEGVDVTLAPPNALLVDCDTDSCDHMTFFPCISDDRAERIVAALLNVKTDHLTKTLLPGFNAALLPTFPFDSVNDGADLYVMHGNATQMIYNQSAPGPETKTPMMGSSKGGVWVMFRATERTDGFDLFPLGLNGDEILSKATAIMNKATMY